MKEKRTIPSLDSSTMQTKRTTIIYAQSLVYYKCAMDIQTGKKIKNSLFVHTILLIVKIP